MRYKYYTLIKEHIHNLYSRDEQFKAARECLMMSEIDRSMLTYPERQRIRDSIRNGLQYYNIVGAMGIHPDNQRWYTELLIDLLNHDITGEPMYEKVVVTISFQSDADHDKFYDKFVSRRSDRDAPVDERYELKIGGITAIDEPPEKCTGWFDANLHEWYCTEPNFPAMTFVHGEKIVIKERYLFGPKINLVLLKQELESAGIHGTIEIPPVSVK